MKNLFAKFAAAALLAAPLAGILPIAAHGAIGGPVCNVPADYATIQAAVIDAGCTTINVAAGTYAEQVAVNRAVVINGANAGIPGNGVRGAESIVDGGNTGTPFVITANNVTINGFTVQNGSNGGFFSGIWSQTGTQNSSIINNIVTQNAIGVWAQCGGNCLVQDNLFDSNNQPGPSGGAGISADTTTGLTINRNEFRGHTQNNPILFQAAGADAHVNDVISNNTIHNNTNGGSAIYALALNNASFMGNDIVADTSDIRLGGGNHGVMIANNILHSTVGVNVVDDGYGLGLNTGVVINRNSLTGHTVAGVDNSTLGQSAFVNATCNWWGAANGPASVGTGSGDPVSANVMFSPWLTTSDLVNNPCNGTAAALNAEDFGVVTIDAGSLGIVKGYTAGFGLTGATFAGSSVVMQLFGGVGGTTLLQTNTSTAKVGATITGVQISSPFDVSGNFDYVIDGFWVNHRETQFGQSLPANRVVATVTLANGTVLTAENNNLTGNPTTIFAPVLTSVKVTPATSTIAAREKGDDKGKKDDGKDEKEGKASLTTPTLKKGGDGDDKGGDVKVTVQLTATDFDQNGAVFLGATTTFSSSNPAVATVSATGLVTGVSAGTATITATSVMGNVTVTGTAVIKVVKGDDKNKNDGGDKGKDDHSGDSDKDNKKGKH